MAKEVVVTHEGYKKLEEELDTLKTVKRSEIAEKIKVARGYGDLSENAEYDAAKEEQAVVEARIADLEATLWFRQTTVITCAAGLTDCIPPPERCFWMSAAALPRQTPPERPMP